MRIGDADAAYAVADRVCQALAAPFRLDDRLVAITIEPAGR